jgi:hypothetical protein
MLGQAKEGRPAKGETLPSGKVLEPTARHRYCELASIADQLPAYFKEARQKYLADEGRIGLFGLRTILRHFGRENDGDGKPANLVKPSDNWNVNKPLFDRLEDNQDQGHHGYIPGELAAEVEAGRLKIRAAARKAGMVKDPDPYDQLLRWWGAAPAPSSAPASARTSTADRRRRRNPTQRSRRGVARGLRQGPSRRDRA